MRRPVCIIQARMGSTRLPGKVMKPLAGQPALWHVIQRVKSCKALDKVVVTTSTLPVDDIVEARCQEWDVPCFRGSETDVLDRYYQAAKAHGAENVMRVTADCPLIDPDVLAAMCRRWKEMSCDYLSDVIPLRSFPQGLDAELFSFAALEAAARQARDPYEREHVTPYLYRRPLQFRLTCFASDENLSFHRWTLDTPQDYAQLSAIYDALYTPGQFITTQQVLNWQPVVSPTDLASQMQLRLLAEADRELLLHWRNQPRVRQAMRHQQEITPKEHAHWFASRPADSSYLIAEAQSIPFGLVNFTHIDSAAQSAEWGFYLGWDNLPKGAGTAMCRLGLRYAAATLKLKTIRAEVRSDNPPSLKLHAKLGFRKTGGEDPMILMTLSLTH